MAKNTARRKAQPKLDIALFEFNAYKRIQHEYAGVMALADSLDTFKEEFTCRDTDHEPNFKYVNLPTKQALYDQLQALNDTMEAIQNQLRFKASEAVRSINN